MASLFFIFLDIFAFPDVQVGVVGNMTVLLVVLSNPHMRTNTNIYLVNLSAADILMCLGEIIRVLKLFRKSPSLTHGEAIKGLTQIVS